MHSFPSILALTFATPGFAVAGLALATLPILIHLLNRRRRKTVPWAAMEFLQKALIKNRRRLRFQHLLLLALRCAAMILIGLALAQPLGCGSAGAPPALRQSGLRVIILDNSYSMAAHDLHAETHLQFAKKLAKQSLDRLPSGSASIALITAARPAHAIIAQPTFDLTAVRTAIDGISQSYAPADEAAALQLARNIAAPAAQTRDRQLLLLDASTRIAWLDNPQAITAAARSASAEFPAGITHIDLSGNSTANNAVVAITPGQSLLTTWFPAEFHAEIGSFGSTDSPKLTWQLDGSPAPSTGSATFTASSLPAGIHVLSAHLENTDNLEIDDHRNLVIDAVDQLKVLIVDGQRGQGGLGASGAFLETALNPAAAVPAAASASGSPPTKFTSYVATERISDLELDSRVLSDYRCVDLCGVGNISDAQAAQLERFVRAGGTLMLFMGDPVTAENYNAVLLPHHLLPGRLTRRITVAADAVPRRFAFDPHSLLHPLLADFHDQENTGMEAAEIYSYWQLQILPDSHAERVLDFRPPPNSPDAPDPAITLQHLGSGRVIFYATSADPNSEWTTFMAHQAYPALMHMLLLGATSPNDGWMNLTVGDHLTLPTTLKLSTQPILHTPDHQQIVLTTSPDNDGNTQYRSDALDAPGLYTLTTGEQTYPIAINLPAKPADLRALDAAGLIRALGNIPLRTQSAELPAIAEAPSDKRDWGFASLAILAAVLAAESFLAAAFNRSSTS